MVKCEVCGERFDALGGIEEHERYLEHFIRIHPRPKKPSMAERVAVTKVWANRAAGYAAIIQMGLIVCILVKNSYPNINLVVLGVPIFVCTIAFFMFIGWMDEAIGVFRAENTRVQDNNTELHEILSTVKKLEIKKLERKKP